MFVGDAVDAAILCVVGVVRGINLYGVLEFLFVFNV